MNLVRTWTIFHKKGDEARKLYLHKSLSKAICNRKNIAKIKDNNFLLPFTYVYNLRGCSIIYKILHTYI